MIIIRTDHDIATHYIFCWTGYIINEAEKRGLNPVVIEGVDITAENVQKRIKKKKPKFISFNGHGTASSFKNNKEEDFINLESAELLSDTITFARSCDCLKGLGKKAVENGCNAFIGYKKKFWIARQHEIESRPLQDPIAKPVLEASNIVPLSLLKGKSVEEAVMESHEYSANSILDLIYSKEPLASASLSALVSNDEALDFEGDPEARIV